MKWHYLLLIFSIIAIVHISSALTVTSEVGETWLEWRWDANQTTTIYVDGLLRAENTTRNFTVVSDAHPSEEHRLTLYNGTTGAVMADETAITLPSMALIGALLIIAIFFAVLTILLKNFYRVLLSGVICVLVSLYLTQVAAGHLIGISILGILLSVVSGTIVILVIADMRTGEEDD